MKITKKRKKIKTLKRFITIVVVILFIELFYALYVLLFKNSNDVYFDGINSIVETDNYYISSGSNNDNNKGYEKAKLTIYDKKGDKVKEKLYSNEYTSVFYDSDSDDGYLAVGSYEESRKNNNKNTKGLFVKYDENLDMVFEKSLGIGTKSYFSNIEVVDDGYLIVGASNCVKKDCGAYLVKYDKDGNLLWSSRYGNNMYGSFRELIVVDDYIYVSGLNDKGKSCIVKYDLDGNMLNEYIYESSDTIGFSDIEYYDNYLYVVGSKDGDNSSDALIVKCNSNLLFNGESSYTSNHKSRYNKLIIDNKGDLVAIGSVDTDSKDGIIAKYDSYLKNKDIVKYGDDEDDYFTDIILYSDGYLVSGYSSYKDNYLYKFIKYSDTLKLLEANQ